MAYQVKDLPPRIAKSIFVDEEDCWLYTKFVNKSGYCQIRWQGTRYYGHLLIWKLLVGEFSTKLEADHRCHDPQICPGGNGCKHRRCLNPNHIKPSTHSENCSNRVAPKLDTHCPEDHEFTEDNTYNHPDGYRVCKICRLNYQRQYWEGIKNV